MLCYTTMQTTTFTNKWRKRLVSDWRMCVPVSLDLCHHWPLASFEIEIRFLHFQFQFLSFYDGNLLYFICMFLTSDTETVHRTIMDFRTLDIYTAPSPLGHSLMFVTSNHFIFSIVYNVSWYNISAQDYWVVILSAVSSTLGRLSAPPSATLH